MTTRDNLRVEQVYFENLKRTMNELAAKKSELDGAMQTLAENAVAADENIIMLYKNLCEAWIEAENLFKKVDIDTQAITERIDSLEKEFNEKIDEVNNYIVSITRALDERLTQAEEDIHDLYGRMDTAEDDIDALEGRMDTAEDDIDALEGRMDTAEGDIDALEGRMTTAEGDIDALEGRMTTAEGDIDALETAISEKANVIYDTISNQSVAHITDGQNNGKVKSLVAGIQPIQSGTGDPSPTNIRPISGRTGMSIVTELNLVSGRLSNALVNVADGKIYNNHDFDTIYAPVESGKRYYIHSNLPSFRYAFYTNVPAKGDTSYNSLGYAGSPTTFTAPISGYIAFTCTTGTLGHGYVGIIPSTTYPISWQSIAGTVYGGTLDVINGTLTVTHGEIASYDGETLPGEWISDRDVYAAGTTPTTGAQVVYELATPIVYNITPTEITTVLGEFNVRASTGDIISMEYPCDTKLYIDKKIAEITPTNLSVTRTEHDFSAAQEVFDALEKTEITDAEEPEEER